MARRDFYVSFGSNADTFAADLKRDLEAANGSIAEFLRQGGKVALGANNPGDGGGGQGTGRAPDKTNASFDADLYADLTTQMKGFSAELGETMRQLKAAATSLLTLRQTLGNASRGYKVSASKRGKTMELVEETGRIPTAAERAAGVRTVRVPMRSRKADATDHALQQEIGATPVDSQTRRRARNVPIPIQDDTRAEAKRSRAGLSGRGTVASFDSQGVSAIVKAVNAVEAAVRSLKTVGGGDDAVTAKLIEALNITNAGTATVAKAVAESAGATPAATAAAPAKPKKPSRPAAQGEFGSSDMSSRSILDSYADSKTGEQIQFYRPSKDTKIGDVTQGVKTSRAGAKPEWYMATISAAGKMYWKQIGDEVVEGGRKARKANRDAAKQAADQIQSDKGNPAFGGDALAAISDVREYTDPRTGKTHMQLVPSADLPVGHQETGIKNDLSKAKSRRFQVAEGQDADGNTYRFWKVVKEVQKGAGGLAKALSIFSNPKSTKTELVQALGIAKDQGFEVPEHLDMRSTAAELRSVGDRLATQIRDAGSGARVTPSSKDPLHESFMESFRTFGETRTLSEEMDALAKVARQNAATGGDLPKNTRNGFSPDLEDMVSIPPGRFGWRTFGSRYGGTAEGRQAVLDADEAMRGIGDSYLPQARVDDAFKTSLRNPMYNPFDPRLEASIKANTEKGSPERKEQLRALREQRIAFSRADRAMGKYAREVADELKHLEALIERAEGIDSDEGRKTLAALQARKEQLGAKEAFAHDYLRGADVRQQSREEYERKAAEKEEQRKEREQLKYDTYAGSIQARFGPRSENAKRGDSQNAYPFPGLRPGGRSGARLQIVPGGELDRDDNRTAAPQVKKLAVRYARAEQWYMLQLKRLKDLGEHATDSDRDALERAYVKYKKTETRFIRAYQQVTGTRLPVVSRELEGVKTKDGDPFMTLEYDDGTRRNADKYGGGSMDGTEDDVVIRQQRVRRKSKKVEADLKAEEQVGVDDLRTGSGSHEAGEVTTRKLTPEEIAARTGKKPTGIKRTGPSAPKYVYGADELAASSEEITDKRGKQRMIPAKGVADGTPMRGIVTPGNAPAEHVAVVQGTKRYWKFVGKLQAEATEQAKTTEAAAKKAKKAVDDSATSMGKLAQAEKKQQEAADGVPDGPAAGRRVAGRWQASQEIPVGRNAGIDMSPEASRLSVRMRKEAIAAMTAKGPDDLRKVAEHQRRELALQRAQAPQRTGSMLRGWAEDTRVNEKGRVGLIRQRRQLQIDLAKAEEQQDQAAVRRLRRALAINKSNLNEAAAGGSGSKFTSAKEAKVLTPVEELGKKLSHGLKAAAPKILTPIEHIAAKLHQADQTVPGPAAASRTRPLTATPKVSLQPPAIRLGMTAERQLAGESTDNIHSLDSEARDQYRRARSAGRVAPGRVTVSKDDVVRSRRQFLKDNLTPEERSEFRTRLASDPIGAAAYVKARARNAKVNSDDAYTLVKDHLPADQSQAEFNRVLKGRVQKEKFGIKAAASAAAANEESAAATRKTARQQQILNASYGKLSDASKDALRALAKAHKSGDQDAIAKAQVNAAASLSNDFGRSSESAQATKLWMESAMGPMSSSEFRDVWRAGGQAARSSSGRATSGSQQTGIPMPPISTAQKQAVLAGLDPKVRAAYNASSTPEQAAAVLVARGGLRQDEATKMVGHQVSDVKAFNKVLRDKVTVERLAVRAEKLAEEQAKKSSAADLRRAHTIRVLQESLQYLGTAARKALRELEAAAASGDPTRIAQAQANAVRAVANDLQGQPNARGATHTWVDEATRQGRQKARPGATATGVSNAEFGDLVKNTGVKFQEAGRTAGGGMANAALGSFDQIFFGNHGFWGRVMHTTSTFLVRNFAAGFVFGLTNALQDVARQAIETQSTFIRIADALDQTGRAAGSLRSELTAISTDYGVALKDVYDTAAGLVGVFQDVGDIAQATRLVAQLQMISRGALNAQEAMTSLSSITGAYGMQGADALTHVADVLTSVQNTTGTNLEVTAEGVAAVAAMTKQLGFSFEETSVYVAQIGKMTGQQGAAAGEQWQRVLSVMQTGRGQNALTSVFGQDMRIAMQSRDFSQASRLMIQGWDSLTEAQKNYLATTLGGQRNIRAFYAWVGDAKTTLNNVARAENANGEAARRAQQISKQIGPLFQRLQQNVVNFGEALVSSGVLDWLGLMVMGLNSVLGTLNHFLQKWNELGQNNAFIRMLQHTAMSTGVLVLAVKTLTASYRHLSASMARNAAEAKANAAANAAAAGTNTGAAGANSLGAISQLLGGRSPSKALLDFSKRFTAAGRAANAANAATTAGNAAAGTSWLARTAQGLRKSVADTPDAAKPVAGGVSALAKAAELGAAGVTKLGAAMKAFTAMSIGAQAAFGALALGLGWVAFATMEAYQRQRESASVLRDYVKKLKEKEAAEAAATGSADYEGPFQEAWKDYQKDLPASAREGGPGFSPGGLLKGGATMAASLWSMAWDGSLMKAIPGVQAATRLAEQFRNALSELAKSWSTIPGAIKGAFQDLLNFLNIGDLLPDIPNPADAVPDAVKKKFRFPIFQDAADRAGGVIPPEYQSWQKRTKQGVDFRLSAMDNAANNSTASKADRLAQVDKVLENLNNETDVRLKAIADSDLSDPQKANLAAKEEEIRQNYIEAAEQTKRNILGMDMLNTLTSQQIEDIAATSQATSGMGKATAEKLKEYLEGQVSNAAPEGSLDESALNELIQGGLSPSQEKKINYGILQRATESAWKNYYAETQTEEKEKLLQVAREKTAQLAQALPDMLNQQITDAKVTVDALRYDGKHGQAAASAAMALDTLDADMKILEQEYGRDSVQYRQMAAQKHELEKLLSNLLVVGLQQKVDAIKSGTRDSVAIATAERKLAEATAEVAARPDSGFSDEEIKQFQNAARTARLTEYEAKASRREAIIAVDTARITDSVGQARAAHAAALRKLADARRVAGRGSQQEAEALAEVLRTAQQQMLSEQELTQAYMQTALTRIGPGDAVAVAQQQLRIAQQNKQFVLRYYTAASTQGQQAIQQEVSAQRALVEAQDAVLQSRLSYAQAVAETEGRTLRSARINAKLATLKYQQALRQAGGNENAASVRQARADQVRAEGQIRDTKLQNSMDTIDFNMTMGRMTASSAIKALQEILRTSDLTRAQRRQVLMKIKGLQTDISNSLTSSGFNIPGEIKLPTPYQVRRSLGIDKYTQFMTQEVVSATRKARELQGSNDLGNVRGSMSGGATVVQNVKYGDVVVNVNAKVSSAAMAEKVADQVIRKIQDSGRRQGRANATLPKLVSTS